ncbi:hypothetical protein E1161_04225 [Saccharopolyspora aridisoli]|uniref:Uncharacterized protein n=1 Tax=Saccharopolyspora aridisoli TaxID=2530385 RepID=A0A4R4UTK3_9PSEU|nr:hypothetical protein [Saccharopolyspora aridisoli]TDC95401.1 hypothetical protein E1161_04225 [Saccharopolyspora aridisoli]
MSTHTRIVTGLLAGALLSLGSAAGCGSGPGWFDTSGSESQAPEYPQVQLPEQTATETEPHSQTPESATELPETSYGDGEQTSPPKTPSDCFATYQTEQSHVQLCEASGEVYYYGSSAVGSITVPAYLTAAGTYRTEINDGYVYTINSDELVITRYGEPVSEQPVTSSTE